MITPKRMARIDWHFREINFKKDEMIVELGTSEELHHVLLRYNWDGFGKEKLVYSIVNSPLCDKGTALMAYWLLNPGYYTKFPATSAATMDAFNLVKTLEERLLKGHYALRSINFDPRNNHGDWVAQNDDSKGVWKIPDELKAASGGEKVPFYYDVTQTEEYTAEYDRLMAP